MHLNRRQLIAASAALLAAGSGAAAALHHSTPAAGMQTLSEVHCRVLVAMIEVWFPSDVFDPAPSPPVMLERVDTLLMELLDPVPHRMGLLSVLSTLQTSCMVTRGALFSALPVDTRAEVLTTWSNDALVARRIAITGVRAILAMAYFSDPGVLEQIGWKLGCGDTNVQ